MIRSAIIVEGYQLDLLEDISTDFTYSISDIREPDKRKTDFSKTINLPGTPKNNGLFAQMHLINAENDWTPSQPNIGYNYNPNKVAKAVVLVDNIEVFRGVIRVLNITVTGQEITYETNVTGRLADILFALGDKKLSDIDFSDMDVSPTNPSEPNVLNFDNILAVWESPANYRYTYPLIDYGMSVDGVNYPIFGFAPAIYAKEYIDRMFAAAGFSYQCPFFDSPYFESLIIPSTEKNEFTTSGENVKYLDMTGIRYDWRNNRATQWREEPARWAQPTAENNPKNFKHPADQNRIYITEDIDTSFQVSLHYSYNHRRDKTGWIYIKLNGATTVMPSVELQTSGFVTEVIEIPRRRWNQGDIIEISMEIPPNGSVTILDDSRWRAPSPTDTSSYPVDDNTKIQMNSFVSKAIAQKEFFKSIILMHNLYIFTDEVDNKNLYIVPQAWFYNTFAGDAVDWTEKLARDREQELIPMGELTAREYLFTYKKDTDYYNDTRYFKVYEQVFGQMSAQVDNDFEKDTHKTELIFSPTISVTGALIGEDNRRTIPHIYKVDKDNAKQRDAFNIRILQYGGMKPSLKAASEEFAYWHIVDSFGNDLSGNLIQYPYAGMLDDPTTPTRDLCFGPPQETWVQLQAYPNVGLYKYWWEGFINEITNKDSKLLRALFSLTPMDINQLDFKRLIKVDNTYFKLNKIENYKPLELSLTRAELFKTSVRVEIERPGFWLWGDDGYFLHSDESPARIPYA